jgi:VanZ family protein
MTVAPAPHLRRAGVAILVASLLAIGMATLWPEPPSPQESPFCVVCGSFGAVDVVLNIVLFLPLGVGLGLIERSARRAVIAACVLSMVIETAQLLLIPGRDATIGDVIANTLGAALGFAATRGRDFLWRPSPRRARLIVIMLAFVWLLLQVISSIGLSLSLPRSGYFGQVAPALGNFDVFRGSVLSATVGDIPIRSGQITSPGRMRQLLMNGAEASVVAIPQRPPRREAPLLRIADDDRREILRVSQLGESFIFSVTTNAAALRLRGPVFSLPKALVFDSSLRAATPIQVVGRRTNRDALLVVRGPGGVRHVSLRITPSHGWILWLPFEWTLEGSPGERLAGSLWIGMLILPLGFFTRRATTLRGDRRGRSASDFFVPIFSLLAVVAGMFPVPLVYGLSAADPADCLAAAIAFILGWQLGDGQGGAGESLPGHRAS